MIRSSDVQWWIQEAKKDPGSAPLIIEELAQRLSELDAENERLRGEVIRLEQGGSQATQESERVASLQRKIKGLQAILNSQTSAEMAVVFLTDRLASARIPLSQVRIRLRANRRALNRMAALDVSMMLTARPQDELLGFTNRGRVVPLHVQSIPWLSDDEDWKPAEETPLQGTGERLTAAATLNKPPRFWTIVTRRGFARQVLHPQLERQKDGNEPLFTSPLAPDQPVAAIDGDRGDLFLITRWGQAVRFPHRAIGTQGTIALEVDPDDEVVGALTLPADSEILVLTAAGYAMRRDSSQIKQQSRPGGSGKRFIQAFDVLTAASITSRGKLLYLTCGGKFVSAPTANIQLLTRLGKGVQVQDLSQDPAVAVTFVRGALL